MVSWRTDDKNDATINTFRNKICFASLSRVLHVHYVHGQCDYCSLDVVASSRETMRPLTHIDLSISNGQELSKSSNGSSNCNAMHACNTQPRRPLMLSSILRGLAHHWKAHGQGAH